MRFAALTQAIASTSIGIGITTITPKCQFSGFTRHTLRTSAEPPCEVAARAAARRDATTAASACTWATALSSRNRPTKNISRSCLRCSSAVRDNVASTIHIGSQMSGPRDPGLTRSTPMKRSGATPTMCTNRSATRTVRPITELSPPNSRTQALWLTTATAAFVARSDAVNGRPRTGRTPSTSK
jgi:hypothetical protein